MEWDWSRSVALATRPASDRVSPAWSSCGTPERQPAALVTQPIVERKERARGSCLFYYVPATKTNSVFLLLTAQPPAHHPHHQRPRLQAVGEVSDRMVMEKTGLECAGQGVGKRFHSEIHWKRTIAVGAMAAGDTLCPGRGVSCSYTRRRPWRALRILTHLVVFLPQPCDPAVPG